MGVAGQIVQYGLWASEWAFGIHDPVDLAQWLEEMGKGARIGKRLMSLEEGELPVALLRLDESLQEAAPEQPRQDPPRQEEPGPTRHPAFAVR